MGQMDEKRQGEIALKLVKYFIRQRGITFVKEDMGELKSVAIAIGISVEQLKQFLKPLAQEFLDKCLN